MGYSAHRHTDSMTVAADRTRQTNLSARTAPVPDSNVLLASRPARSPSPATRQCSPAGCCLHRQQPARCRTHRSCASGSPFRRRIDQLAHTAQPIQQRVLHRTAYHLLSRIALRPVTVQLYKYWDKSAPAMMYMILGQTTNNGKASIGA